LPREKPLAWDVTVPATYLYLTDTATIAGAAVGKAASTNEAKYRQLANSRMFVPVAVERARTWKHLTVELIQEVDRRILAVTQNTRKTDFMFLAAFRGFTTGKCGLLPRHFHHRINVAVVILLFLDIFCLWLCHCGLKNY